MIDIRKERQNYAQNQADINNDWDTYVAEVEAQNMQNIVDMYNDTYNASK